MYKTSNSNANKSGIKITPLIEWCIQDDLLTGLMVKVSSQDKQVSNVVKTFKLAVK